MGTKLKAWEAYRESKLSMPPGYSLEFGADVLILRNDVGSEIARFSARGAAPAEVARAAGEDYRQRGEVIA